MYSQPRFQLSLLEKYQNQTALPFFEVLVRLLNENIADNNAGKNKIFENIVLRICIENFICWFSTIILRNIVSLLKNLHKSSFNDLTGYSNANLNKDLGE
jgi:hypothetical protein